MKNGTDGVTLLERIAPTVLFFRYGLVLFGLKFHVWIQGENGTGDLFIFKNGKIAGVESGGVGGNDPGRARGEEGAEVLGGL